MKPKAGGHIKENGLVDSKADMVSEVVPLQELNMKVRGKTVFKTVTELKHMLTVVFTKASGLVV